MDRIGFSITGSSCWTMGLDLSEVGLVEFDGFEVELSFLTWVFKLFNVEFVMDFVSLVLFLDDELVVVRLRSLVWFFVEPSFMVLVWFLDERVIIGFVVWGDFVWFFFNREDVIFFLIGRS